MRDVDKINRQVFFIHAQGYDAQEEYPKKNNTFKYFRAPEGYKFLLHSIDVTSDHRQAYRDGIVELSDGHYYTGWDIFPGVENKEVLWRGSFNVYNTTLSGSLNLWECKEITIAIRSITTENVFKVSTIIWYYLKPMSKLETLFYALVHPRFRRYKKAYATTLDPADE
ncbi:unnamed protein product [marine sediment metagenome]|uniref:Uncharacterized protein n=1 Tax=marine sediment metagenome TaxID=412755 RepID=X1A4L7_9ZZZZ